MADKKSTEASTPDFEDEIAVSNWVTDTSISNEEANQRSLQADANERAREGGPRDAVLNAIATVRNRQGIGPSANQ